VKSKILLVDDSPTALFALEKIFEESPKLEVVGRARTRAEALSLAQELRPDLVTMDVYLGGQDGIDVARAILALIPTRVVMVTGLDSSRADLAFRALNAGALDVLEKPSIAADSGACHKRRRFLAAVQALAEVRIITQRPRREEHALPPLSTSVMRSGPAALVLGASTGGPPVLHRILQQLPSPFPVPIFIVQHIESGYVQAFADWLTTSGHQTVVAERSVEPAPGVVYLAPSDQHLRMGPTGVLTPRAGAARRFQLPSIDELFESLVSGRPERVFAALLTGMGDDGAEGLQKLALAGSTTAVQSLESCVVPGMPSAALRLHAGHRELTPEGIAQAACHFFMPRANERRGIQG
jgi:two-component system chemotaxis response regulator CheB